MPLAWDDIQANAIAFSKRWKNAGKEEQEAQNFVTDFLRVFGVDEPLKTSELEFKNPTRWRNNRVRCITCGLIRFANYTTGTNKSPP